MRVFFYLKFDSESRKLHTDIEMYDGQNGTAQKKL